MVTENEASISSATDICKLAEARSSTPIFGKHGQGTDIQTICQFVQSFRNVEFKGSQALPGFGCWRWGRQQLWVRRWEAPEVVSSGPGTLPAASAPAPYIERKHGSKSKQKKDAEHLEVRTWMKDTCFLEALDSEAQETAPAVLLCVWGGGVDGDEVCQELCRVVALRALIPLRREEVQRLACRAAVHHSACRQSLGRRFLDRISSVRLYMILTERCVTRLQQWTLRTWPQDAHWKA